jgi:hypothetical protein
MYRFNAAWYTSILVSSGPVFFVKRPCGPNLRRRAMDRTGPEAGQTDLPFGEIERILGALIYLFDLEKQG